MNKFFLLFSLFFLSNSFIYNFQDSENHIKIAIPTKFCNFIINKEEKIKAQSIYNNKKQSIENLRDISFKVYALINELKITDKIKKDLSQYKKYDEDLFVVLNFDKSGKIKSYNFQQESVLVSFNEFYKELLSEVK